jgi:hypothetical protein
VQPAWESNAKRDRGKCRPEEEKYIDGKIGKNHVAGRSLYTTSVIENNTSVEVAMREDTRGENRASILAVLKQEAIASVNQPRNPNPFINLFSIFLISNSCKSDRLTDRG